MNASSSYNGWQSTSPSTQYQKRIPNVVIIHSLEFEIANTTWQPPLNSLSLVVSPETDTPVWDVSHLDINVTLTLVSVNNITLRINALLTPLGIASSNSTPCYQIDSLPGHLRIMWKWDNAGFFLKTTVIIYLYISFYSQYLSISFNTSTKWAGFKLSHHIYSHLHGKTFCILMAY